MEDPEGIDEASHTEQDVELLQPECVDRTTDATDNEIKPGKKNRTENEEKDISEISLRKKENETALNDKEEITEHTNKEQITEHTTEEPEKELCATANGDQDDATNPDGSSVDKNSTAETEESRDTEPTLDGKNKIPIEEIKESDTKAEDNAKVSEPNEDQVKEKEEKGGKSRTSLSSGPKAPTKTVSSRSARPSARRDAMAKFQKDHTPGVRNFKVQRTSLCLAGGASIKQKILQWCRNKTQNYEGVCIENFSSSWNNGLAFCALIHHFFPSAFDFSTLKPSEREKNFTLAFRTAESLADCCPLLEVSDMILMGKNPDPMCVFTYVQSLCHHLSKIERERKEMHKNEQQEQNELKNGDVQNDKTTEKEQINELNLKTTPATDHNENVLNTDVGNEL